MLVNTREVNITSSARYERRLSAMYSYEVIGKQRIRNRLGKIYTKVEDLIALDAIRSLTIRADSMEDAVLFSMRTI